MVAMSCLVLFGIIGLAVDLGRIFVMRAQLSRAVDAAALAGVQQFPDAAGAQTKAQAYLLANEPNATPNIVADVPNNWLEVNATMSIKMIFIRVLGVTSSNVSAHARAGFGLGSQAITDVVLVIDDTGTMRSSCNGDPWVPSSQTNATCPVKQARDGAKELLDILPLSCAGCKTQVAIVPFRGCYSDGANRWNAVPMASEGSTFNFMPNYGLRGCVVQSEVMNLSSDRTALKARIDGFSAPGGWPGTNLCVGMREGYKRLAGAGAQAGAAKIMVVLTDGDQRYSDGAENASRGGWNGSAPNNTRPGIYNTATWPSGQGVNATAPDSTPCRPTGATNGPLYPSACTSGWLGTSCAGSANETNKRINTMDVAAYNMANTLKGASYNTEIYVLRFADPAGDLPAGTACNVGQIGPNGSATPDRSNSNEARDQNFSRCIASAPLVDHYFYAATPADIPIAFQKIAQKIAIRLLE